MPDTRRQQIIAAVDTQLKTIKKNTYNTDLGNRVKWQKDTSKNPVQEQESQTIVIEVADGEIEYIAFNAEMHEILLSIKAVAHEDIDIQDKMRADIIKAMYNSGDCAWSGLADDTRQTGLVEFDEEHGEYKFLGVELEFTIQYQTAAGDPYNLPT